jgi:hypothetical protein
MPSKSPLYALLDIRDNARLAQLWTMALMLKVSEATGSCFMP